MAFGIRLDEDRPTPCAGVALQVYRKGHECLGHRQRIDLGREAELFDDPNTLAEQDRMDFRVVLLVPTPYPPVVHAQATYLPLDKPARGFRREFGRSVEPLLGPFTNVTPARCHQFFDIARGTNVLSL